MKQIFFLLSMAIGLLIACGGSESDKNTGAASQSHSAPQNGAQPHGGASSALDDAFGTWSYSEQNSSTGELETQIYELYRANSSQIFLKFDFEEVPKDKRVSKQKVTVTLSVTVEPNTNLIQPVHIEAVEFNKQPCSDLNDPALCGLIRTKFDENVRLVCKGGKLFRLLEERGQTKEVELTRVEKKNEENEQEILKKI